MTKPLNMVIGTYLDGAGRTWSLKVHAKGEKHEWYSITSPLGDSSNNVYAVGQAKYVLGRWKTLKETRYVPSIV